MNIKQEVKVIWQKAPHGGYRSKYIFRQQSWCQCLFLKVLAVPVVIILHIRYSWKKNFDIITTDVN